MSDTLKSTQLRRESEAAWHELEQLVSIVERKGLKKLTAEQTLKLPALYRQTLSSLSVARSISLDAAMLAYLESLSARAYLAIYGVNAGFGSSLWDVLWYRVPAAIRQAIPFILAATLVFLAGTVTAYALVSGNPDWYFSFMPEEMASGRTPTSHDDDLRLALYPLEILDMNRLQFFSSFLFTHNAGIAMLAFALGFAFGIPTILLLFHNGCTLGAFIALYAGRGMTTDVLAWLSVHGTTEISAILICGAGGMMLGSAAAFPGRYGRLTNLSEKGRQAALMLVAGIIMLFAAGFLEGYARQLVTDIHSRFAIGAGMFALWLFWFTRGGRSGRYKH